MIRTLNFCRLFFGCADFFIVDSFSTERHICVRTIFSVFVFCFLFLFLLFFYKRHNIIIVHKNVDIKYLDDDDIEIVEWMPRSDMPTEQCAITFEMSWKSFFRIFCMIRQICWPTNGFSYRHGFFTVRYIDRLMWEIDAERMRREARQMQPKHNRTANY